MIFADPALEAYFEAGKPSRDREGRFEGLLAATFPVTFAETSIHTPAECRRASEAL